MNRTLLVFWLIFILFFQIVVFNNVNFMGYINPYVYVAIVFLLPLSMNRFLFLLSVFMYGITLDFFSDSGGIHAFSLLFIAYIRELFVKIFFKKTEIDFKLFRLNAEPFGSVFNYVVILTLIHHLILFTLANFSFQNLGSVLIKTLFSGSFTLIIYFLGSFIFRKKQIS